MGKGVKLQSTRTMVEVESRRNRVSELYLAGKGQHEIAAICTGEFRKESQRPVSQQTISADIKAIRREWRTLRTEIFEQKIDKELARIDQVEREAWDAWKRSVGKVKTIRNEEPAPGAQGAYDKTVETIEVQAGDPRFLQAVQECVKKRCEILGLNAATKSSIELTGDTLQKLVSMRRAKLRGDAQK